MSQSLYDEVKFESQPSPERHPDRMYVLARLAGIAAKLPCKAKVLEIGCSTGAHLIPLAEQFPEATFVGIDLSNDQISVAQDDAQTLKLKNISFRAQDFRDLSHDDFDYVICHGVFSWIAETERVELLRMICGSLASEGVAYLSHNVLPGWTFRKDVRDSLISVVDRNAPISSQIESARESMKERIEILLGNLDPNAVRLKDELQASLERSDSFIVHELLAEHVSAASSSETFELAKVSGLYYFAEALPTRMSDKHPLFSGAFAQGSSTYDLESIHDKICLQSFRGSLFSTKDVFAGEELHLDVIPEFTVCSSLVPKDETPDIHSETSVVFFTADEKPVPLKERILKAGILYLRSTWPRPVPFSELCENAWKLVSDEKCSEDEQELLITGLYQLMLRNQVEFFSSSFSIANRLPKLPLASAFTRLHAVRSGWITTRRHEYYPVNTLEAFILERLDGSHSDEKLVEAVLGLVASGQLHPHKDGQPITDESELQEVVAEEVIDCLKSFVELGIIAE